MSPGGGGRSKHSDDRSEIEWSCRSSPSRDLGGIGRPTHRLTVHRLSASTPRQNLIDQFRVHAVHRASKDDSNDGPPTPR